MRKFRNAALAVATATTVAISGVSVAAAENDTTPGSITKEQDGASGSSKVKEKLAGSEGKLGWTQEFDANDVANWFKGEDNNTPWWAKLFIGGGIAAAAASVLGLIVAPAYNFLKYNGFLG
ncbi:hypothetical protein [Corynebacterium jeikeium]|uniref:hypothetical protein n=1 Tax=Corynebacterium jeikeium TaxID=38289 RepID=UPI00054FC6F8|nr:hypothetical protein [Corynebacterium jeikeium]SQI18631.1 hypothetical membrane protein [Corynebacterium jeikeium]